jgi:hypothetical protein
MADFSDSHLVQLAHALDFDPDDLDANRAGRLTARQIARLQTDQRWQRWPVLAALTVVVVIAVLMLVFSVYDPVAWAVPMVGLGGLAIFAVSEFRGVVRRTREAQTAAACATFRVHAQRPPLRRRGRAEWPVEGRWFALPEDAYAVLAPGRDYCLYYAPDVLSFRSGAGEASGSYRVLSLEPVPNAGEERA